MSTDTLIADATVASGDGDVMSPAEKAYFESRGEKTDGLSGTDGGSQGNTNGRGTDFGTDDGAGATQDGTDPDMVDGEVDIDATGVPRDPKTGRYVPKSAFLRVKAEAKSNAERLSQVAEHLIRLKERDAVYRELSNIGANPPQKQDTDPDPEPDMNTDVFGYIQWMKRQHEREIEGLKSTVETTTKETRETVQAQQMRDAATRDMKAFASKEPAFVDAYNYLIAQRDQELEAGGVRDPAIRHARIQEEAKGILIDALSAKESPAERIFRFAKIRGFQPKATQQQIDPAAQEQIERINKGQQAAASLRGSGTTGAAGEQLTVQKLIDMTDNEYSAAKAAYVGKHGFAAWRKLLGKA